MIRTADEAPGAEPGPGREKAMQTSAPDNASRNRASSSSFLRRKARHQLPDHPRLQAVGIGRIELLGRHPELESAPRATLNASSLSHAAAQG